LNLFLKIRKSGDLWPCGFKEEDETFKENALDGTKRYSPVSRVLSVEEKDIRLLTAK